ncbi:protein DETOXIFICATION 45, chloroplastic-like [Coffea eugenioides]|uniref:protein DETOXIFICATION 45, chloroplastic-like n=1 Tax=Coffea eugenioides TaxID=49369 RepID=UPI000F60A8EA|nr:protein DETOXIFICATION 45, chloroplastic-like [Coffea eugenioides]
MAAIKLNGGVAPGISGTKCERRVIKKAFRVGILSGISSNHHFLGVSQREGFRFNNAVKNCAYVSDQGALEYEIGTSGAQERFTSTREKLINGSNEGAIALTGISSEQQHTPSVQTELIMLSVPAIAGQAIEPLAQLMETAYIGKLGALDLASAGISICIFNIISKVFNIPLLSVATSFVAEDISRQGNEESSSDERMTLPSVSTALVLSMGIGLFEAAAMFFGSGVFLSMMGISMASPMRIPAEHFLKLRALGAPAVVLSLAIQGILRGFKDTRTPVLCLGLGNFAAVFFFPVAMYVFQLGVTGAAISTVASQYIVTLLMLWHLNKRTALLLPSLKSLHFGDYLKSGGFLLGRTLAAVLTVTLSTSMAARQGALSMAAHQICLQVWLSASLLVDAQAAAGQALIASSLAKRDYGRVKEITYMAIKTGLFTGISIAVILGLSFPSIAKLFTNDVQVLDIVKSGLLFVSASQPLNALAYIFDGLHYGVSDFPFAACSMMVVGAISSAFLLYAPSIVGLTGVWSGLTIFMGLRTVAGYTRLLAKDGPWWFLQENKKTEVGDMKLYS